MNDPLVVIERATPENWNVEGYLLANRDVAADPSASKEPRQHFDEHGLAEGRLQFSSQFLNGRAQWNAEKYSRFAPMLEQSVGSTARFRFTKAGGFGGILFRKTFPVSFGSAINSLSDYDGESANPGFGPFVEEVRANPDKHYLDIGSGLRTFIFPNCLYLEVYPSITADVVMEPACRDPLRSASFDGISCLAVLEHVEEPWTVAQEIHRLLKPGGLVFIDWPFLQPVHGYPSHFYNATREGLQKMFSEGFELIECDTFPNQTPDHALSWFVREWAASLPEHARAEFTSLTVADLMSTQAGEGFWQRLVEATPDRAKMVLACGNSLVARKL